MTESVQAVADIVIETISPSMRRFHCRAPFIPCALHDIELEDVYKKMGDESLSDEERERAHERFHELEENNCPVEQVLTTLDTSEEKNLILDVSHSCKGAIDIVFNLALIDSEQIQRIEEQIIGVITSTQLLEQTPTFRRVSS